MTLTPAQEASQAEFLTALDMVDDRVRELFRARGVVYDRTSSIPEKFLHGPLDTLQMCHLKILRIDGLLQAGRSELALSEVLDLVNYARFTAALLLSARSEGRKE